MVFRDGSGAEISSAEWLATWNALYPRGKYDREHDRLMSASRPFGATDFERIGRWKDAAWTEAKWRANVASVGYIVWMQAVAERPSCPDHLPALEQFLRDWSERTYAEIYSTDESARTKRFGLSRATTLLYFLSAAKYPIFDSRVRRAVVRLSGQRIQNSVHGYLTAYLPFFEDVLRSCGTSDRRLVDRALFSYGGKAESTGPTPAG